MAAGSCLAVDFGTTNTVAVATTGNGQRGDPVLQRLKFGNDWRLPSAVFWDRNGPPVVGVNAERSQRLDPTRFVRCPKREMGHGAVLLGGVTVPVAAIVTAVLDTVHREAVQQLGAEPDRVVLTRPVQWAAARRAEFESEARAGGFLHAEFLEEPEAAAIRLGSLAGLPAGSPFAVLDFGGGTLDVAVVQRSGSAFDVLASGGADPLGGEDIDDLLFSFVLGMLPDQEMARQLAESLDPVVSRDRTVLRTNCRLAKEQLSEQDRGLVGVPHAAKDLVITREEFDDLAGPVLQRVAGTLTETVLQYGFEPSAVPVYLVGGSSRIPGLARTVASEVRSEVRVVGDPQFVVSEGAALWAGERTGAQRGRMLFERVRERYPEKWAATVEAGRLASETLRTARERARESGGRVREAAEHARQNPRVHEVGERVRLETERLMQRNPAGGGSFPAPLVWLGVAVVVLLLLVVVLAV
jgi:molecular chaperone DnaK (HSP70)